MTNRYTEMFIGYLAGVLSAGVLAYWYWRSQVTDAAEQT